MYRKGWAFHPKTGGKMRVTLHETEGNPAAWTLELTPDKGLAIANEAGETLLELKQDKRIILKASIEKRKAETSRSMIRKLPDRRSRQAMDESDRDNGLQEHQPRLYRHRHLPGQ